MRHLVYYVDVSLDGKIATPSGGTDAFATDGDHLATILRDWSDTIPGHVRAALGLPPADGARFSAVLMGWHTYAVGLADGVDSPYPHLRQFVVSTRRPTVPPEVEVIDRDPLARVRHLKAEQGRDIWLCGGGALAGTVAAEIDRLVLKVNPVVLGAGIPLFGGGGELLSGYDLHASTRYDSGVMINEYRRAATHRRRA
jgi:dihydrofolate reductase